MKNVVQAQVTNEVGQPLTSWVTGAGNESCESCGLPAMHLHVCDVQECLKNGIPHGHCINCESAIIF